MTAIRVDDQPAGTLSEYKEFPIKSGKLDEELSGMSKVVDVIVPGSVVLLNESFASTNELEARRLRRRSCKPYWGWVSE